MNILEQAKQDMQAYGEEVLNERAIPDFRDGLKPVHRRILWTMYLMGLKHNGGTKKSARVVGEVMGRFHPHGDVGLYQTLVNLTGEHNPEPTVYGQGNFGGIEEPAAAMRYTEVKLTKFSDYYLLDPDYIAVTPMVSNYDDTEKEPLYLPCKLPGPFLFGTEGIAIGCSNLVPSFSIESVIELVRKALEGDEINENLLYKTLEFKFENGGRCCSSKAEIKEYFQTGFGKLSFRAIISRGKKDNLFTIDTMAPRLRPSKVEEALSNLKELSYVDLVKSANNPRWFEITIKKSADEEDVIAKVKNIVTTSLYLQTYMTVRHETKGTTFRRTNLVSVLKSWIKWRLNFEKKVIQRLIGLENVQIQKYDWLIWACNHLELIRKALESKDPDAYLVKHGGISLEGANWILSQQVRRLARLELKGLEEKRKERSIIRNNLEKDLNSQKRLVSRIINSLEG